MHNLRLWCKFTNIAGYPIIEPCADCNKHIGMRNSHICRIGSVHAEHAQKQRVLARESPKPHERIGYRCL